MNKILLIITMKEKEFKREDRSGVTLLLSIAIAVLPFGHLWVTIAFTHNL